MGQPDGPADGNGEGDVVGQPDGPADGDGEGPALLLGVGDATTAPRERTTPSESENMTLPSAASAGEL